MAQAKDEKEKREIKKKETQKEKLLITNEYWTKGNVAYEIMNFNSAIEYFTKAIELNPNLAEAYYGHGLAYKSLDNRKRDYIQAISDFTQAIRINPNYAEAYSERGVAYLAIGDNVRAISDYNRAIEIDPNESGSYIRRGIIYNEMGNAVRAISDFQKACDLGHSFGCVELKKMGQ